MKKNSQLYNALSTLVLSCLPLISLFAQDPGGFDEVPIGTLDTPIDGGLSLLIAAGVGYGLKKVIDERKKNREAKAEMDKWGYNFTFPAKETVNSLKKQELSQVSKFNSASLSAPNK